MSARLGLAALIGAGALALVAHGTASAAERAYELVSPPGVDANVTVGASASSPDGEFVCYHSENPYLDAFSTGSVTSHTGYCARRTGSGWRSEWATGPRPAGEIQSSHGAQVFYVSPDGERVAFATGVAIFGDWIAPDGELAPTPVSAYLREGGVTRWVAPSPVPPGPETGSLFDGARDRIPLAVSEDLRHGIFNSVQGIVPEDTNGVYDVYEWTPGGVRLVSRDGSGNAVGGLPVVNEGGSPKQALPGAMSRDGSRVFFLHGGGALEGAPAGALSVFRREGDDLRLVSPRRGPGPAEDVRFAAATADGGTVFLLTAEQLTDEPKEPGPALYRYDVDADELSLVATHADGIQFLDLDADGSTLVYTTASGATPPLIVNRDGVEHVLGTADRTLDSGDQIRWGGALSHRPDRRGLRVSADGRVVVFGSAGAFAGLPAGTTRVYRWEDGEGVVPVAVDGEGQPAAGRSHIGNYAHLAYFLDSLRYQPFLVNMRGVPNLGRVIADDGRALFFETTERLLAADLNDVVDVYEWRDGKVSLVSPGTQTEHAYYHDSSADGRTVFFTTASRLIPELDRNASPDLYAARVGGGFPLPVSAQPCRGDGCQGDVPVPPRLPSAGTGLVTAESDVEATPRRGGRHRVVRFTRAQLRAFAATGRTVVRARVSRPGVVRVRAVARLGRRKARVGSARARASRAGTVRVALRLSRRARARLRRGKRLAVTLRVSYSQSRRVVNRRVVLNG